jgi:hypothetical protein
MADYGFDPKYLLISLVKIYTFFLNYNEFLEFIVKDERSYKIENFEKVLNLKEEGKISLDFEVYESFKKIIEILKNLSEEIKSREVLIIHLDQL